MTREENEIIVNELKEEIKRIEQTIELSKLDLKHAQAKLKILERDAVKED